MPKNRTSGKASRNPVTGVTPQQERFAAEYVKTGRLATAYRRSYNAENMSEESCRREAQRLLEDPRITPRIEHYRKSAEKALEMSVQDVTRRAVQVVEFDVGDCFDEAGKLLPLHEMPTAIRKTLAGFEIGKAGTTKVRFPDRVRALELLARIKRMIIDRVEHVDPNDPRNMSDEELEASLRADEEALKLIEAARVRTAEKVRTKNAVKGQV